MPVHVYLFSPSVPSWHIAGWTLPLPISSLQEEAANQKVHYYLTLQTQSRVRAYGIRNLNRMKDFQELQHEGYANLSH